MGRTISLWLGVCMAAAFGTEAAYAQDRRAAATRDRERLTQREARPAALLHHDVVASSPKRAIRAALDEQVPAEQENAAPGSQPRKKITFFRINSDVGEIAVQPVAGRANGLQFSLGF
jgi:hypothetical protein